MSSAYPLGGTCISLCSVSVATGVDLHSMRTMGVPLPHEPSTKISCAVPTGHSGTNSGPSKRVAFADDSVTSYAVALPMFWTWNSRPVDGVIAHRGERLGRNSSSWASTRSVRVASARNDWAIESCEFVDRSVAEADRSAAATARSAMWRASAASTSALAAARRFSHHPTPEPIKATADSSTATRSVLNQLTRGTVAATQDTGGAA